MSVAKKILQTKIPVSEKLIKENNGFIKLCFVARKKSTFTKNQEIHNFNNISND